MMKFLAYFLFVFSVVVVQVSFLTTWPRPISSINLVLSLIIFVAVIISYEKGLLLALLGGMLLELYSGMFFGIATLSLVLTVMAINFLFTNFFTNRSLYSLIILGFVGTAGYNLIAITLMFLVSILGGQVNLFHYNFWNYFFWQPALNLLILAVIFFAYYLSSGRLKNIFLSPN